jgi:hypothetical protein
MKLRLYRMSSGPVLLSFLEAALQTQVAGNAELCLAKSNSRERKEKK